MRNPLPGFLVFLAAGASLWAGLGSYGLVETSDARYAEISLEMWRSGDYLFPRFLGLLHFHKPPLIYWLTSLGYTLFGPTEWGARACLGALGIVLLLTIRRFASRHLDDGAALWSVAFAVSTPAVIAAGRALTTDLLLATCQSVALVCWYDLWSGKGGRLSRPGFYLASGLSFLAKGPVAWLALAAVIIPFSLLHRGEGAPRPRRWGVSWGAPLALAVALPWYIYVVVETPGLWSYFLGDQLASRLSSEGMGHAKPWWYFAAVFPALGFPWVLLARRGWTHLRAAAPPAAAFLALWLLAPPLLFSFPATKLPLYPLLSYPALALLAACALSGARRPPAAHLRAAGAAFLALGLVVASARWLPLSRMGGDLALEGTGDLLALLLPAAALLAAGGAAALGWARARPSLAALGLAAALAALPGVVLSRGDELPLRSAREVGTAAAASLGEGDVLAEYRSLAGGLPFYAGRLPLIAGVTREKALEEPGAAARVTDGPDFLRRWGGPERILVVTRERHAADLPGAQRLAEGGSYVLLANR